MISMHPLEPPRCQLHSRLAPPGIGHWLRALVAALRNRFRLRSRWRAWQHGSPPVPPHLGTPSRFAAGTWVRILEPERVFATLNRQKCLRGLPWVWQQWPYCGSVHQVFRPVRRMMDDAHTIRPISGTVLIDTVPCSGPDGTHGCGRECPMMFRDEWLEEVPPPPANPAPPASVRYARVRSEAEIRATLDSDNSRHGLLFMPEMYALAGQRFPIRRQVNTVLDGGRPVAVQEPVYILDGLHCSGEILSPDGPCERACRLLWHEDWLQMEGNP